MHLHNPAHIIQASRELEGAGISGTEDDGLSSQARLRLLSELAMKIHRAAGNTHEHAALVDRYNTNLYLLNDWLQFRNQTLPPAACIPDEWTLLEYLEMRGQRPVSFRDFYQICDRVAHVKIKRRSWFGSPTVITAVVLRNLKGAPAPVIRFTPLSEWGIRYEKGAEYLIWLTEHGAIGSPMPVLERNGRMVVQCSASAAFFEPVPSEIVSDFCAETDFESVVTLISDYGRQTAGNSVRSGREDGARS